MSFLRSSVWLLAALAVGCAQAPDALEGLASERGGDGGPVETDPAPDDYDGGLVGRDPTSSTTPGSIDAAVRDGLTLAPRSSTDAAAVVADAAPPVAPVVPTPVQDAGAANDAAPATPPVTPRPEQETPVPPPATPPEPPPVTPVTPEPTPDAAVAPDTSVPPPVEQPPVDAGTGEPTVPAQPVAACAPGRYQGELTGDLSYSGLSSKPRITGTIALVLGQGTTAGVLPIESGTITATDALGGTLTGRITGSLNCANGQLEGGKLTGMFNPRLVQNPLSPEGTVGAAYVANDKALRGAWQVTAPATIAGTTGGFLARLVN